MEEILPLYTLLPQTLPSLFTTGSPQNHTLIEEILPLNMVLPQTLPISSTLSLSFFCLYFLSECVFTPGAWINNRSLFPCQEPPGALATWQAKIRAPKEFVVLMSGDDEAITSPEQNGDPSAELLSCFVK